MANNEYLRDSLREAKEKADKAMNECNSLSKEVSLFSLRLKYSVIALFILICLSASKDSVLIGIVRQLIPNLLK